MRQHLRHLPQNRQRVHHLIVIIHQVLLPQPLVVPLINRPNINAVRLPQRSALSDALSAVPPAAVPAAQRANLPLRQHLVLDISDQRPDVPQIRLRRPRLLHLLINLRQNTAQPLFIRNQLKGLPPQHPAVIADNLRTDPINCPKLQPRRQLLAKKARKPAGHIARGGNSIRHCQNILRRNAAPLYHVAKPQNQYRGLAAPRHRQQKHRPLHCFHRFRLLSVERDPRAGSPVIIDNIHFHSIAFTLWCLAP